MVLFDRANHIAAPSLSAQQIESPELKDFKGIDDPLDAVDNGKRFERMTAPGVSSRMSIERYLSAPIADEPASAPAISAAIRKQTDHNRTGFVTMPHHSRDTSTDIHSEGRRTVFTSGSGPETVDTSYTVDSGCRHCHHGSHSANHTYKLQQTEQEGQIATPSRSNTATVGCRNTPGVARERIEILTSKFPQDGSTNYRTKVEDELAHINAKAKELELSLQRYASNKALHNEPNHTVINEAALGLMANNPKLARLLGGEIDESTSARSGSSTITSSPISDKSRTAYNRSDLPHNHSIRKSKSNSTLNAQVRQGDISKVVNVIERRPSKRLRCFCTFCLKGFDSRAEWVRHERIVHMPEELWVCCPRTGKFPTRCPFCDKGNPSPAHLADHDYISCQAKPVSERTFDRSDHFLQHISQVHRVPPEQKPSCLSALQDAWKTPTSVRSGHPALHCGFCGANFRTYQDRTRHVGRHFLNSEDVACWWESRISHDIQLSEGSDETSSA